MASKDQKRKLSEKAKGKLITLAHWVEGVTQSYDGTKIAYRSFGQPVGKSRRKNLPIICCNGLGVSSFFWVYLERHFRKSHQVITWDYRGHGQSELKKNPAHYDLNSLVMDCKAVLDALKIKKAIFVGHSLGVQVIFEIYRKWPKRVAALVPCFGTYGHPMDSFYNTRLSRYLFEIFYKIAVRFPRESNLLSQILLQNPLSFWMGGVLKVMHTGMVNKEDIQRYIEHILTVDPVFFNNLLKSAQEHTAQDMLKTIKVPTLVVAGELDQFTPMWISKKMHQMIPKSELFIMYKATHAGLVEQPDLFNLRIEKFIEKNT